VQNKAALPKGRRKSCPSDLGPGAQSKSGAHLNTVDDWSWTGPNKCPFTQFGLLF